MVKKGTSQDCEVGLISQDLSLSLSLAPIPAPSVCILPQSRKPTNQAHQKIPLIFMLPIKPHSYLPVPHPHLAWDTTGISPVTQFSGDSADGYCHHSPLVITSHPSSWDHSIFNLALLSEEALFHKILIWTSIVMRSLQFSALVRLPPEDNTEIRI